MPKLCFCKKENPSPKLDLAMKKDSSMKKFLVINRSHCRKWILRWKWFIAKNMFVTKMICLQKRILWWKCPIAKNISCDKIVLLPKKLFVMKIFCRKKIGFSDKIFFLRWSQRQTSSSPLSISMLNVILMLKVFTTNYVIRR